MASAAEESLNGLAAIAGAELVTSEPSICADYAIDGCTPRWVVYPPGAEAVAATLQFAAEQNLTVIPCCSRTKLSTGNLPRSYDVALCLREMNQVRYYEPDDLTASVEPGMTLGDFQRFLSARGLWIPLDPPGGSAASLGGIVAANSSGPLRLKYGGPRDMVLGMKIALPSGMIIKTGGRVVKNVAGYDLAKLMIGSWGTLGVIVEINFKLYPKPAGRATWIVRFANCESARSFRRLILDSSLSPLRMVLLDARAALMPREEKKALAGDFEIWVEFGGSEPVLRRSALALEEISKTSGATTIALESSLANTGWNRISNLGPAALTDPKSILLKAALPIVRTEEFISIAQKEASVGGVGTACFGQNGAGIVHVFLFANESGRAESPVFGDSGALSGFDQKNKIDDRALAPVGGEGRRAAPGEGGCPTLHSVVIRLREIATAMGGSLVILRCPPEMKRKIDTWGTAGNGLGLMRKLKEALDPKGTLSTGRFVGGM